MVDTVRIEETQVANWAKEETLKRLVAETRTGNDILTKIAGDKLTEEQIRAIREGNRLTTDNTKRVSSVLGNLLSETKGREDKFGFDKIGGGIISSVGAAIERLTPDRMVGEFSSALAGASISLFNLSNKGFSPAISTVAKFAAGVGLAASAVLALWEDFGKLTANLKTLYSTGIQFQDGLDGLNRFAFELGLSGRKATEVLTKFSTSATILGIDKTKKLINSFENITKNGSDLLMTNEEAVDAVMRYADMHVSTGELRKMSDKELAKSALAWNKQIIEVAAATGKDRQAIEDHAKALLKAPDISVIMSTLPESIKKNVKDIVAQFQTFGEQSDNYSRAFIQTLKFGPQAMDDNFRTMLQLTHQYEAFVDAAEKTRMGDTESASKAMKIMRNALSDPAAKTFMGILKASGDASAEMALQAMAASDQYLATQAEQTEELEKYKQELSKSLGYEVSAREAKAKMDAAAKAKADEYMKVQEQLSQSQHKLSALYEKFVTHVLPHVLPGLDWLSAKLSKAIDGFDILIKVVPKWWDQLTSSVSGWYNKIAQDWGQTWEDVKNVFSIASEIVIGLFNHLKDAVVGSWTWVSDTTKSIFGGMGDWLTGLWATIKGAWDVVSGKITNIFDSIKSAIEPVLTPFRYFSDIISKFATMLQEKFPWIFGSKKEEASTSAESATASTKTTGDAVRGWLGDAAKSFYNWATYKDTSPKNTTQIAQNAAIQNLANSVQGFGTTLPMMAQQMSESIASIEPAATITPAIDQAAITGAATATQADRTPNNVPAVRRPVEEFPVDPAEMHKETMEAYKSLMSQNNASIQLLSELNERLIELNQSIKDQTGDITSSIDGIGVLS